MNLRQLAEQDLAVTLTDKDNGGAVSFTISKPSGTGYTVNGFVGDIGYLLDTEGNPIAGRTVTAIFRMSDLMANNEYMQPGRGWKVIYTDMSGHEWILYVARFEPDRTLGVGRLILSLNLEAKGE
ncbi:MAG: hypothetical protein K5786_07255 [Treponema sp.]|jgi:hypothetical protein|nr:hypothetical protein [Treponema sp.]